MTRSKAVLLGLSLFVCCWTIQGRSVDKPNCCIVKKDSTSIVIPKINSGTFAAYSFSIGAPHTGLVPQGANMVKDMPSTTERPQSTPQTVIHLPCIEPKDVKLNATIVKVSARNISKSDGVKFNGNAVNDDIGGNVNKTDTSNVNVEDKADIDVNDKVDDDYIVNVTNGRVVIGLVTGGKFEPGSFTINRNGTIIQPVSQATKNTTPPAGITVTTATTSTTSLPSFFVGTLKKEQGNSYSIGNAKANRAA